MLPEYDFEDGIRGKHYKAYRKGHNVKIYKLEPSEKLPELHERFLDHQ